MDDKKTITNAEKKEIINKLNKGEVYFKKLDEKYKCDKDIAIAAINVYYHNIDFISDEFKNNKEFVLELFSRMNDNKRPFYAYYTIFMKLSEMIRNDKEIATLFINQYYECLKYTSEEIRNDKDLILSLFKKYADDKTMKTVEILQYTSDRLLCDKDFIIKLMTESTRFYLGDIFKNILYECILEELKYDDDIIHLKDRGE